MQIYLVGGAVRDELLGLPIKERDWLVVGASTEAMLKQGFRQIDRDFPVFLHPETGEEYALARRELKTGLGYKGFTVEADPQVTLEEDLARRDLTINAIAQDENGQLLDPFGGQADLACGKLRHVTQAFVEDPVRLLRLARFSAVLGEWGFHLAHDTFALAKRMAQSEDLSQIRSERLWREMEKALKSAQPWRFFQTLQRCEAWSVLFPPFAQALVEQGSHGEKLHSEPIRVLQTEEAKSLSSEWRLALFLATADLAKTPVEAVVKRFSLPKIWRTAWLNLLAAREQFQHMDAQQDRTLLAENLLDFVEEFKALREAKQYLALLQALKVLEGGKTKRFFEYSAQAVTVLQSVTALSLADEFSGKALGQALRAKRIEALRDQLLLTNENND